MWTILLSILWLFVESTGIPLLSEGAFGPLGAAVHHRHVDMWTAFFLAWGSVVVGNTLGFGLFSLYGHSLTDWLGQRWPKLHDLVHKTEPWARRHIFVAITISRFVGLGTFGVVLWIAGIIGTPWKRFLPFLYVLDLVWTAAWLFGSTFLVRWVIHTFRPQGPFQVAMLIGGALAIMMVAHWLIGVVKSYLKHRSPSAD